MAATSALARLHETLARYSSWAPEIRHAVAAQASVRRDHEYLPPSVGTVAKALEGKTPANAADLRAIMTDELTRLASELRTGPSAPWKAFWNTDENGKATTPKIENIDRDMVLSLLGPRMEKYHIALALPEAQRRDDSRVDVLIASGAGRNLPIEAKRHYHKDLWSTAGGQLQGYASDPGAEGFGIMLVFWFGDVAAPPKRADGKVPSSAGQLKARLEADLAPALRGRTDIIVLDVAAPEHTAPVKKKAAGKSRSATPSTQPSSRVRKPRIPTPTAQAPASNQVPKAP